MEASPATLKSADIMSEYCQRKELRITDEGSYFSIWGLIWEN